MNNNLSSFSSVTPINLLKYPIVVSTFSTTHPLQPFLIWTAGCYLFVFNFRENDWVVKRKKIHDLPIRSLAYSPYLKFWLSTGDDKKINLLSDLNFEIISSRKHLKKVTSLKFVNASKFLCADKFGFIYLFDVFDFFVDLKSLLSPNSSFLSFCRNTELDTSALTSKTSSLSSFSFLCTDSFQKGKQKQVQCESLPVISHLALITDMCLTSEKDICFSLSSSCSSNKDSFDEMHKTTSYVISGDRDGKIRVSRNPNFFYIQCFCLGHTNFVTSLLQPSTFPDIFFSAAADSLIKCWCVHTGKEYWTLNIQENAMKIVHSSTFLEKDQNQTEEIRYNPSKLYWDEKFNEILIIVEHFSGFFRLPVTMNKDFDADGIEKNSFSYEEMYFEHLTSVPQCLLLTTLSFSKRPCIKEENTNTEMALCHNTSESVEQNELSFSKNHMQCGSKEKTLDNCESSKIFWVDRSGRLRKPIRIYKNGKKKKTDLNYSNEQDFWIGMDIGDDIPCEVVNYWKHNFEDLEIMKNDCAKPKLKRGCHGKK